MSAILLSREAFKSVVLARNAGACAFCAEKAVDAHHIMERRLFPDGGYYAANGVGVCSGHHLACETTDISVEEARRAAGIEEVVLPPHLEPDQKYDKWGNPILANGQRLRGELFYEDGVQKALKMHLNEFTDMVKAPRTYHLPWSLGVTDDDKTVTNDDLNAWEGKEVVVTEKMDGENTSLYADHIHARSLDGMHHPSRSWVKQWWASIAHDIPSGWRVCGENVFAQHSVVYDDLESYFLGFGLWDERNVCLSWDTTLEWFALLGVTPVKELYRGVYDVKKIQACWSVNLENKQEGYVARLAQEFPYSQFRKFVAKFVRPDHVRTDQHWRAKDVVPNRLYVKVPVVESKGEPMRTIAPKLGM